MQLVVIQDKELCGACGGRCCKQAPGLYIPSDFGGTEDEIFENLHFKLNNGQVTTREGVPTPRARYGDYGQCNHLTNEGCSLGDEKPSQCKALNPGKKFYLDLATISKSAEGLICNMTKGMGDNDIREMWDSSTAYQLIRLELGYPV